MRIILAACAAILLMPMVAFADSIPSSLIADPPQDKADPAKVLPFALQTGDVKINALFFAAAGAGQHPTVLLLHGIPGNEQNLDLARAVQREGWNVLTLHYRGSWGSAGQYSYSHCFEDAAAALAWLRDPKTAMAPRIDTGRIVVIGHSLGGLVAGYTGAHDPGVMATAMISPASGGARSRSLAEMIESIDANIGTSAGMHTVNVSPEALAQDWRGHEKDWHLIDLAEALGPRPLLIVTSEDGLAPPSEALRDKIRAAGGEPAYAHFATDHSYNDQRVALTVTVIRWLESLPGAPARR